MFIADEEVICCHCRRSSSQRVVRSFSRGGTSDLDLRPAETQRSAMLLAIQACPHCQYVATELAKRSGDLSLLTGTPYRAIATDPRVPELARRFLATAMLIESDDPLRASHERLCAAWACDDAGHEEQAADCRRRAAAGLRPLPAGEAGISRGAVLVDVLRRAGQFEGAASACDSLRARSGLPPLIEQVLAYQARLIEACDPSCRNLADVATSR